MAVAQSQCLRVFGDATTRALGNPCQLTQLKQKPSQFPSSTSSITQCYAWPLDGNTQEVCCVTSAGKLIQCCGHGLLASAAVYLQNQDLEACTLKMGDSFVACHRRDKDFWLVFNRLTARECEVPAWVSLFFKHPPQRAALAGDESAYLVLEWPNGYPLETLSTPNIDLQDFTGRALIVTARHSEAQIGFRYFAPQYGVSEDVATGSAMRVLADYWFKRCGYEQLRARQYSSDGGLLLSRLRGGQVEVGGSVEMMNGSESNNLAPSKTAYEHE